MNTFTESQQLKMHLLFFILFSFNLIASPIDDHNEGQNWCIHTSFEEDTLCFELSDRDRDYYLIHWQISTDPTFQSVNPDFEHIEEYTTQIYIDDEIVDLINLEEDYFFRFKTKLGDSWAVWSEPHRFTINRPRAVSEVNLENTHLGKYCLSWTANEQGLCYHVFGSNCMDFDPSMGKKESEENGFFLFTTENHFAYVNDTYRYYRIVAEKQGHLSFPSALASIEEQNDQHFICKALDLTPAPLGYVKSPEVSQEVWDCVSPYFLPTNHPAKAKLDRIFSHSRVTANRKSLKQAGFKHTKAGKWSHTVVTRHPKLKGYLIKLYTDDQEGVLDWAHWRSRVIGALETKKAIDKFGYHSLFKVPKKWIYPIPDWPSKAGSERRHFILIVEDVNIVSQYNNLRLWRSTLMTQEKAKAIYTILQEVGLSDTIFAFNLPFTRKGKLAFIDTEFYHQWPVHYNRLSQYFSSDMRKYWIQLTR